AMGASLISVIATSSAAASAYLREGFSNIRIGMFLEIATTTGAVVGAFLAPHVPAAALAILLGLVLLHSAYLSTRPRRDAGGTVAADSLAERLRLSSTYPTPDGERAYDPRRVKGGFAMMTAAGIISGLLGIGSGAFKVIAMDQIMRIPFKVSTTTSN